MSRITRPTRTLPPHPDLDQLRRQAKELLGAFQAGDATAMAEVDAHYRDVAPHTFALHDARLVLARAYGFDSVERRAGRRVFAGIPAVALRSQGQEQAMAELLLRRSASANVHVDSSGSPVYAATGSGRWSTC